jgi:outer membrane immunogenic protein
MKLTLMAGATACIFSGPAVANDWEGLSLGIGGGYGMANSRFRDSATVSGSTLSETSNGIPGSAGLFTLSAGYDHALLGTLVVGGFIDYDFADIGSRSYYELGNQLSVGGRLGYLVAPTTLFYSSFGYAHTDSSDIVPFFGLGDSRVGIGSFDGYFIGSGVETLIGGGFSLKAEYRYTSLQAEGVKLGFDPANSLTTTLKPTIQTARVSLNYRFGNGKQEPVDNSIPPVTSSWTGVYMGLGGGYGVADTRISAGDGFDDAGVGHFGSNGGIISFTLGYDRQLNTKFVAGAFADADYMNFHYSSDFNANAGTSVSETVRNNFRNMLMVGGRIGYLTAPDTLLFVSAGYANAGLGDTNITASFNNDPVESLVIDGKRFSGGFVGGGVETRINDSLSLKAEYRYADFGSENASGSTSTNFDVLATKFDPAIQMGRLSINYRFGSPSESAAAPLK